MRMMPHRLRPPLLCLMPLSMSLACNALQEQLVYIRAHLFTAMQSIFAQAKTFQYDT